MRAMADSCRLVDKAGVASTTALFTYARLWLFSEQVLMVRQDFLVPVFWPTRMQLALFTFAFLRPSRVALGLCVAMRISMYTAQAPMIWDSSIWANFTDCCFLSSLVLCADADVLRGTGDTVRVMMGMFYVAAGFWKLNSAFLDATVSCGPIYVASLLAYLPPALTPIWLVKPALAAAPLMTIAGEMVLGVCLLSSSRPARRAGVLLSGLLHFAIAITPHPNSVPTFGVMCMVRMFHVMPHAWTATLRESLAPPGDRRGLAIRAAGAALVAGSCGFTSTPGFTVDYAIPLQFALCLSAARAALHAAAAAAVSESPERRGPSALLRVVNALLVLVAFGYAFLSQPLGLMDIGAASPFASIRLHGGSNHLLMPTGLLQRWAGDDFSRSDLFGGGVVRVTRTDSAYLNALWPANCTGELRPRITSLLRDGRHIALQFNPTARRTLGPFLREHFMHRWRPESGAPFEAFTIPAFELRRTLEEVRQSREAFAIEYERLPGVVGDEAWRTAAWRSRVAYTEDGRGGRTCRAKAAGAHFWAECADDEIVVRPFPPGLGGLYLWKTALWFAYPIIEGIEELPCMD